MPEETRKEAGFFRRALGTFAYSRRALGLDNDLVDRRETIAGRVPDLGLCRRRQCQRDERNDCNSHIKPQK